MSNPCYGLCLAISGQQTVKYNFQSNDDITEKGEICSYSELSCINACTV